MDAFKMVFAPRKTLVLVIREKAVTSKSPEELIEALGRQGYDLMSMYDTETEG